MIRLDASGGIGMQNEFDIGLGIGINISTSANIDIKININISITQHANTPARRSSEGVRRSCTYYLT